MRGSSTSTLTSSGDVNPAAAMGNRGSQTLQKPTPEAGKCVPHSVPSIIELKKALPPQCFTPTLSESFYFVAKDLFLMSLLYASVTTVEAAVPALRWVVLPLYWYLQGTLMWAVFVLGHDCGHGSFSSSTVLNDIMGNALHGLILVPYYPWKMSHQHHHKNTGNIDK